MKKRIYAEKEECKWGIGTICPTQQNFCTTAIVNHFQQKRVAFKSVRPGWAECVEENKHFLLHFT